MKYQGDFLIYTAYAIAIKKFCATLRSAHFTKEESLKEKGIAALVGHACAGKSSISHYLSEYLGLPVVEVDRILEDKHSAPIGKLPNKMGEEAFIESESTEIMKVLDAGTPCILVIGASGLYKKEIHFKLRNMTYIIQLRINYEAFCERFEKYRSDDFQLVRRGEKSEIAWFNYRSNLYNFVSDEIIDTDFYTDAEDAAMRLYKLIEKNYDHLPLRVPNLLKSWEKEEAAS